MTKIAILGYGTVSGGVAEILHRNAAQIAAKAGQNIEVKYILVRRAQPQCPWQQKLVEDFSVIENDPEVSIVVEAIGGSEPAHSYCERALRAKKHVVTANKQIVAEFGAELGALAKENGVNFLFEASVGGGIPVLHPINRCLGANVLQELSGILNGTTNFILTQMLEHSMSYADALYQAQQAGYAEADPTADVEGLDAARKICVLADLAFGKHVDLQDVYTEGITRIESVDAAFAEAGGMKIKLLGRACSREEGLQIFVSPHFVPKRLQMAGVSDAFNAVEVMGSEVGRVMFYGPGAGRYPTASAVIGDVIDLVQNPNRPQPALWEKESAKLADHALFLSSFYIRVKQDRALVAERLAAAEIHVHWLPDQEGSCGGITEPTCKNRLAACGVDFAAIWPVYDG